MNLSCDTVSFAVCHPFGNPTAFELSVALHERGLLDAFHTGVFGLNGFRRGARLMDARVVNHGGREWVRAALGRIAFRAEGARANALVQWVCDGFDAAAAKSLTAPVDAVYCYEDSAAATLESARARGAKAFYELPAGYFRGVERVIHEETGRRPELAPFFAPFPEPPAKQTRKTRELELADVVVCASSYAAGTTSGYCRTDKVVVIPYGCDTAEGPKVWDRDGAGPVRLLYAGQISPRKGIHVLFEALSGLPDQSYELSLAGVWRAGFQHWIEKRYRKPFRYLGKVPHREMHRTYTSHDVLVFPTLSDGFGLVLLEAMAAGIPVVASRNSAGPDLIHDGTEGFLVAAGDAMRLRDAIGRCIHGRETLPEMGAKARKKAEMFSWATYRERMAGMLLRHVLADSPSPFKDCAGV